MNDLQIYRETKSVAVRRSMADNPGVIQSLNTIERVLFQATTETTIEEYDERTYIQQMTDALKWIAKDIGIRDTDGPEWSVNAVRICKTLARYYGNLTIKEIRLAFEMSVAGELDDYFPKDRYGNPNKEHYQNFNIEYVCRVIQAYNKRRANVIVKAYDKANQPDDPERVAAISRNYFNDKLLEYIAYYKEHDEMPVIGLVSEVMICGILSQIGIIDDDDKHSPEIIREAFEYIKNNDVQIKDLLHYESV